MQKPAGMSRKDYHAMKAIIREQLGNPNAMVEFVSEEGETRGFVYAVGHQSFRHDEGYSATGIQVFADEPGRYSVQVENRSRDCDGPHSSHDEFVVGPAGKRRRWYWNRNWKTNRPEGKFGMKSAFKILKQGRSSQRDYFAEAAGY